MTKMANGDMLRLRAFAAADDLARTERRMRKGALPVAERIDSLQGLGQLASYVGLLIETSVNELRVDYDVTWSPIGDALGVTKQAAQQRFGR